MIKRYTTSIRRPPLRGLTPGNENFEEPDHGNMATSQITEPGTNHVKIPILKMVPGFASVGVGGNGVEARAHRHK